MSVVTTVLVLPDAREGSGSIELLNSQLVQIRPHGADQLRELSAVNAYPALSPSDHWGGPKAPEADVWGAAFNHISGAEVVERARKVNWSHPVLILYQDQDDFRWSYVTLGLNTPEGLGEDG